MGELSGVRINYSYLKGFVRDCPALGSDKAFAAFLRISPQELNKKYSGVHCFTIPQIVKIKKEFGLSPQQIDLYFFNL